MNWIDVEEIAESLEEKHPEFDIISVRFTKLKQMILELEEFQGEENKCNERVLEAIQANWIELRDEQ